MRRSTDRTKFLAPNDVLQHPAPRIVARRADRDVKGRQVLFAWMGIASRRSCIPVGKPGYTLIRSHSGENLLEPIVKPL
jgi:hypothetical protein